MESINDSKLNTIKEEYNKEKSKLLKRILLFGIQNNTLSDKLQKLQILIDNLIKNDIPNKEQIIVELRANITQMKTDLDNIKYEANQNGLK